MYHINKEITRNGENLTLKNTAKHYYKKFDILGASKQETRSGKNLCKLDDKTETSNGITSVITNGVVSVKGTATSTWFNLTTNQSFTLKAGTYTVSVNKTLTQFGIDFYDSSATVFSLAKNLTSAKFTLSSEKTITRFVGVVANGEVLNIDGLTFQIEEGSVATEYEQYGVSPSIEYPSDIESVGDNINLCDNQFRQGSYNIPTNTIRLFTTQNYKVEAGKTYTLATNLDFKTYKYSIGLAVSKFPEVAQSDLYYDSGWLEKAETTFTSEQDGYFGIGITRQNAGVVVPEDIKDFYFKLVEGTSTGAYSPYGQGSIEIYNCNENLFDFKKYFEGCGVSVGAKTLLENGIRLHFKPGTDSYTATVVTESQKLPTPYEKIAIKVKPNTTYTLQMSSAPKCFVSYLDSSFVGARMYYQIPPTLNKSVLQIKTNAKTEYLLLRFGVPTSFEVTSYDFTEIQLIEGTIEKEYIEHQSETRLLNTQQPFRAIGDVKDRFVEKAGVWYERHNILRKIFNGTEEISYISQEGNQYVFQITLPGKLLGSNDLRSSHFKVKSSVEWGEDGIVKRDDTSEYIYVYISRSDFRNWLVELYNLGTPLYVDYVLVEPELIPCTPEQVEQLEEIEKETYSYDEVTNIYSTDTISPYFDVIAYQRISEEIKTRLKEGKITRGYLKVLATDTLPEIIIDENNCLKDLKIEELRYVPEEGFIGGAVAKRVSGNFNNVDSSFNIQDREIEAYLGVELEDETTEYIKYGTYIVQRPEDDQVTDNTSFEALDYMVKFNQEYKDRITYPCKLKELLNDVLDQAGVNSKTNTFANSDFIVENNQFEQGTTLRDVIKAIAQMAFNWARIDEDDNFVMDFEINEEVDEELSTDDYFGFKKTDEYGPVNVIVLRNSQVEGENVTIKDEELINSPKGDNILPITLKSQTVKGVEITVNKDNSITLNGQATEAIILTFSETTMTLKGNYVFYVFGKSSQINFQGYENGSTVAYLKYSDTNEFITKEYLVDTTITNLFCFINANTIYNNETFKFMITKGTEVKQYEPYIPVGEVELVIADNPFAYTELKRKQLIEAGRRLFGLRYTPMTVDMLGLMYLNARDRISVENLNGEKFKTYLLDHTIDYTGIVLDSMESKAKTQTETKYQYVSPLSQGLSHVEIKVDKANKKIESIIQTQEDVSEKVANTVARIEVVYALSDSPSEPPTDNWDTKAPEWTVGKYMWQKTITTYANGTTAETAATNISGAKGEAGQNGIGITQTNITYQKSTSGTTVPKGTWQTTIPEVDEDGYLWTRTEFIYSDGSEKYAYNVGKKGATGIGVKSLVDQYYLSTSNTEQTGGEWTETQPEWQDNTYIWTRTKINWTDNSITYTDPVLANTLNDINSNIVVLRELSSSQIVENGKIITRIEETTKRLNNDYSTTEQVDSKIDGLEDKYETLEKRFVDIEASNKEYAIKINAIDNNGVDKIKTLMGYTFNDEGLNIDRPGADTATLVNEKGVEVSDKTGASSTPLLYAGYVEEGNDKFPDYEGQTIVATSNLIVKNFLVIGSNSRFQDYINPVLGGQGTGAYDI